MQESKKDREIRIQMNCLKFHFLSELSLGTVLETFGEYFFSYCLEHGYDKMLRTLGDNFETFMQNLDALHSYLAMSYKNMKAPSFR